MKFKSKPEFTNKPKGIAVKYRVSHPGTPTGYSLDPNFEYKLEIANLKEVLEQEHKALEKIAAENGFSMNDWNPLAEKLAFKHEPSLKRYYHKEAGRPKQWNAMLGACLWFDVTAFLKRHTNQTVAAACSYLSKQTQWSKSSFIKANKPKSLEVAYVNHALKSPLTLDFIKVAETMDWETFVKIFERTFAVKNREKNLKEWSLVGF